MPESSLSGIASGSSHAPNKTEISDVLEERLIDAEYKIWKKNTPYLYDFVMTHSLEWPSLTCQWLPNTKSLTSSSSASSNSNSTSNANSTGNSTGNVTGSNNVSGNANVSGNNNGQGDVAKAVEHNLLVGTHTTGEQNYLMVASVNLPQNDTVVPPQDTSSSNGNSNNTTTTASTTNPNSNGASSSATFTASNYDEEKNEVGGFGTTSSGSSSSIGKIEIRMKIKHIGEVNRARYMPQNHFIVASRGPNPEIYIWDLSKHCSFPDEDSVPSPQGVCIGHKAEGYGMCWSRHKEGMLVTASEDSTVCLWDVKNVISSGGSSISTSTTGTANGGNGSGPGTQTKPINVFSGHTDVVEDVDWHHRDVNLIGSVSDDRSIRIWDIRENHPSQAVHCVENAHDADVNSIAFNPVNEFLFATGSADKTVALWDMRNLKSPIQTLRGHSDQVYNIEWSPFNESILASSSSDRRVGIWDLSRIGAEQTPEDAEDGPPELLFLHGGHTSKVSDFSWNKNDEWTIASVSEDNVLQVWNMAEEIYAEEEDEMSGDEDEEDADMGKALDDDDLE